jgi:hypothetical protein
MVPATPGLPRLPIDDPSPGRLPFPSMNPSPEYLEKKYAEMSDLELCELAFSYDSLTETARAILQKEMTRRSLDLPESESHAMPATSRKLVTIRRYRDLSEAIVVRTFLESAGLPVYLRDENLVRLDWQISNFIGGIRLQVEAADEQAALELLIQPIPETIEFGGQAEFDQPHCHNCDSTDITFLGASRGAALASVSMFSIPLPQGAKTWQCNQCETRWNDEEGDIA